MNVRVYADRRTILRTGTAMAAVGLLGHGAFAAVLPGSTEAGSAPNTGAGSAEGLMQPGIPHALAVRRAAFLSDIEYDIDLDLTREEVAPGKVKITFQKDRAGDDVVLDFRGPTLTELRANGHPINDFTWRNGHVRISGRFLAAGTNVLEARFATPIGPSGTALIRFDDESDGNTYLYTLLVPADAHLLFPCFDQPDLKARIRWTLSAPEAWTVVGNSPVEERRTAGGVTTWTFAPTEPIPVYVTSFAAGPWKAWHSEPAGERPITLYARGSRADEVDADAFIRTNRETVEWLGQWLGVGYPFSKFDLLLAPAFPFGAMEHVGTIFYSERSAIFREAPTLSEKLNRDQVVYHEVSHQWFGNYLTMKWFDDLWLKEGFSTFISSRLQADLQPNTDPWKTFYLRLKPSAYNADTSSGTAPLWQTLENLNQAGSNYGPIVYNKAPSIIKQLWYLVGEEAFRGGLQALLRRHSYGNATWRDLLAAIERTSGVSLDRFGEKYILKPGLPRVDSAWELDGERIRSLTLTQRPANQQTGDAADWWPMKIQVRLGYSDRPDVVLPVQFDGPTAVLENAAGLPAPDFVWANDGDYGYGLFMLDEASATWVSRHVGKAEDDLLRAMFWGALWERVRDTQLAPFEFMELALRELPREQDEQVAKFILDSASTALSYYVSDADAQRLAPRWERLLVVRARNSALSYGLRKDSLDALAMTGRTAFALDVMRGYLAGKRLLDGEPIGQVTRWNVVQRLLVLGAPGADKLYQAEVEHDATPEARRMAFIVGAAKPDLATKREYFQRYFEDEELNEGWARASFRSFNQPEQQRLLFEFLEPALERLEWIRANRSIAILPSWINAFFKPLWSTDALRVVDGFLATHPELPIDIRRKLLEARDDAARTVRIRRAAGANVTLGTSS